MSNHTPGPWALLPEECDRPYIRIRGTAIGGRYKIANVLTPVYQDVHAREAEETRANARLMAAAPDLLESLKAAKKYVAFAYSEGIEGAEEAGLQLDSAIAKAEGANQ